MSKRKRWHIEDWTGKICFGGRTFNYFEEAWGFIYEADPDEEAWQDYYVMESK